MKYIDRKTVGVASFLASCSTVFSELYKLSSDIVAKRLGEMPAIMRVKLSRLICSSMRDLIDSGAAVSPVVPDDIIALCESGRHLTISEMSHFFDWLIGVHVDVKQSASDHIAALGRAASSLDRSTASFVQTFFSLSNQRAIIESDGGDVKLIVARREWGSVRVVFGGCDVASQLMLPCFIFSAEITPTPDGRFAVGILADTQFDKDDTAYRLLRDDGWQELHFVCESIRTGHVYPDYVSSMRLAGDSRSEIIRTVCEQLTDKADIVGSDALSAGERAFLPTARILSPAFDISECRERDIRRDLLDSSLEPLGNRYAVSNLARLFSDCGCSVLSDMLSNASDMLSGENEKAAKRSFELFSYALDECIADGSARAALYRLSDMISFDDIDFDDDARTRSHRDIAMSVRDAAAPRLEKLGFRGEYPHYIRESDGGADYISFILTEKYSRPRHETMYYDLSVAAAHIDRQRYDKIRDTAKDASDCRPEYHDIASYGEMASSDDGEFLELSARLSDESVTPISPEQADRIAEYISFAQAQFAAGRIPNEYRRRRRKAGGQLGRFGRAFSDCLPIGVIAAIVIMIGCLIASSRTLMTGLACILSSIAAGIVATAICALIKCIIASRRLWRY